MLKLANMFCMKMSIWSLMFKYMLISDDWSFDGKKSLQMLCQCSKQWQKEQHSQEAYLVIFPNFSFS